MPTKLGKFSRDEWGDSYWVGSVASATQLILAPKTMRVGLSPPFLGPAFLGPELEVACNTSFLLSSEWAVKVCDQLGPSVRGRGPGAF